MKKILFFTLIFMSTLIYAQNKKVISDKDLVTICKTWGVLKYYEPNLSNGKVDADSLLIKALEQKFSAEATLANWIAFLETKVVSQTDETIKCEDQDSRNFSIKWIEKEKNISKSQKKYLTSLVEKNTIPGGYYSKRPDFIRYSGQNEKVYKDNYLEENYRLLNLFRIWNVIEYFYPYKYGISKNWDTVLKEFIPIFKNASDEEEYTKTVMLLSGAIEDTHSRIESLNYKDIFGKFGAPFTYQIAQNKIVVTKPIDSKICDSLGIKYGDVIEKIDGKSVEEIIEKNSRYISASNASVKIRDSYHYMFSGKGGSFTIKGFDKENKPFEKKIVRLDRTSHAWFADGTPDNPNLGFDQKTQRLIYSFVNKDTIGYIEFSLLESSEIDSLMTAMKNTKGIVFDLRGYNSNASALKIFSHLFPEPKWFGILTKPDFQRPGMFCWQDYIIREDYKFIGKNNPDYYKGKVVVLVNENTQSASEMFTMIFKMAPNVTVIGSQTAGADGNETPIKMVNGESFIFSGVGIFYPDKKETQRIGIVPDINCKPTISDLQNKIDAVSNKAFEFINN